MKDYLKNIIPRIKQYSKGLDKIEVFVGKTEPWIYVDENGGQHQYIFLREERRLIMIFNGVTKVGKWELLPTNQLLIDRVSDIITLDHLFVEKALLILKRSGTEDLPFVLISKEEIPDLDVESYLEKFQKEKDTWDPIHSNKKYTLLKNGELMGPLFYEGLNIVLENEKIISGTYKIALTKYNQFAEVKNNEISRLFYKIYQKHEGRIYIIEQKYSQEIVKNDIFQLNEKDKVPTNKYFQIRNNDGIISYIKCDSNGRVIKVLKNEIRKYVSIISAIILIIIIISTLISN